jgi:hypothetical protein
MKHLLLSMLLLAAAPVMAQLSGNVEYNLWTVQQGDTLTIFSDKAYIREAQSAKATILDSLTSGSTVIAAKLTETEFTLRGITAPWWWVKYKAGDKQKEGYLWLGLAAFGAYHKDSVQLLYGIEKVLPAASKGADPKYLVQIKALNMTGHLLDKKELSVDGGQFAISTEAKLLGNMGLDKLSAILRLYFSGEACAIPNNFYYYGWTGTKFLPLPDKSTMFDAGAVSHDEVLLFPKEPGGQAGKIIKLITDEEYGEDGETVVKKSTNREVYLWNGEKAVKQ